MQKTKTVNVAATEVVSYTCNFCGLMVQAKDYLASNDIHSFKVTGGYGSTYPADCATLSFELCGPCLKKVVANFKFKPEFGSVSVSV